MPETLEQKIARLAPKPAAPPRRSNADPFGDVRSGSSTTAPQRRPLPQLREARPQADPRFQGLDTDRFLRELSDPSATFAESQRRSFETELEKLPLPQLRAERRPLGQQAMSLAPNKTARQVGTTPRLGDQSFLEMGRDALQSEGMFAPDKPAGLALDLTLAPAAARMGAQARKSLEQGHPGMAAVFTAAGIVPVVGAKAGKLANAAAAAEKRLLPNVPFPAYSRLEDAIERAPFERGTAEQWKAALQQNVAAGERQWTGIDAYLDANKGQVIEKAQIRQVSQSAPRPKVVATTLGKAPPKPEPLEVARARENPPPERVFNDVQPAINAGYQIRGTTAQGLGTRYGVYDPEGTRLTGGFETPEAAEQYAMAHYTRAMGGQVPQPAAAQQAFNDAEPTWADAEAAGYRIEDYTGADGADVVIARGPNGDNLGMFDTPEQAQETALAYARMAGVTRRPTAPVAQAARPTAPTGGGLRPSRDRIEGEGWTVEYEPPAGGYVIRDGEGQHRGMTENAGDAWERARDIAQADGLGHPAPGTMPDTPITTLEQAQALGWRLEPQGDGTGGFSIITRPEGQQLAFPTATAERELIRIAEATRTGQPPAQAIRNVPAPAPEPLPQGWGVQGADWDPVGRPRAWQVTENGHVVLTVGTEAEARRQARALARGTTPPLPSGWTVRYRPLDQDWGVHDAAGNLVIRRDTEADAIQYVHRRAGEVSGPPRFDRDAYNEPGGTDYHERLLRLERDPITELPPGYKPESLRAANRAEIERLQAEADEIYAQIEQEVAAHPEIEATGARTPRLRELLDRQTANHRALTRLPDPSGNRFVVADPQGNVVPGSLGFTESEARQRVLQELTPKPFVQPSHFPQPNIMVHYRADMRKVGDENVMFLQEIQSDWMQKLRARQSAERALRENPTLIRKLEAEAPTSKNREELKRLREQLDEAPHLIQRYKDVPGNVPFTKTDEWIELALKDAIHEAHRRGADRIAWTTGLQQQKRWSVGNATDHIEFNPDTGIFRAYKKGREIHQGNYDPRALDEVVGKGPRKRLLEAPKNEQGFHALKGEELRILETWPLITYDQGIPQGAQALAKKLGIKLDIEPANIFGGGLSGPRFVGDVTDRANALRRLQKIHKDYDLDNFDVGDDIYEGITEVEDLEAYQILERIRDNPDTPPLQIIEEGLDIVAEDIDDHAAHAVAEALGGSYVERQAAAQAAGQGVWRIAEDSPLFNYTDYAEIGDPVSTRHISDAYEGLARHLRNLRQRPVGNEAEIESTERTIRALNAIADDMDQGDLEFGQALNNLGPEVRNDVIQALGVEATGTGGIPNQSFSMKPFSEHLKAGGGLPFWGAAAAVGLGGAAATAEAQGTDEAAFQRWYKGWAAKAGIDPNPDNPLHKYDYRAAFRAGAEPQIDQGDGKYHWPSQFKAPDHPNRFVNGVDTRAVDQPDFGDVKAGSSSTASETLEQKVARLAGKPPAGETLEQRVARLAKKPPRGIRAAWELDIKPALQNPLEFLRGIPKAIAADYEAATNPNIEGGYKTDVAGVDATGMPIRRPMDRAEIVQPGEEGSQTLEEWRAGARRTGVNAALAPVSLAKAVVRVPVNAALGALDSPDDRLRGATTGAVLGEAVARVPRIPGQVARAVKRRGATPEALTAPPEVPLRDLLEQRAAAKAAYDDAAWKVASGDKTAEPAKAQARAEMDRLDAEIIPRQRAEAEAPAEAQPTEGPRRYVPTSDPAHTAPENAHVREIAEALKTDPTPAQLAEAATEMAARVPEGAILIPMPGHAGAATGIQRLADAIAEKVEGATVLTALERSRPVPSSTVNRRAGKPGTSIDEHIASLRVKGDIPPDAPVVLIDNVETSGATTTAAKRVLGREDAAVVAYAKAPVPDFEAAPARKPATAEPGPKPAKEAATDADGLFFEARAPSGGLRPFNRVSTDGLIKAARELEERMRRDAAATAYRPVETQSSGTQADIVQMAGTRTPRGTTYQAEALQRLQNAEKVKARLEAELESRGINRDEMNRRVAEQEELDAALERERLDYDQSQIEAEEAIPEMQGRARRQTEPIETADNVGRDPEAAAERAAIQDEGGDTSFDFDNDPTAHLRAPREYLNLARTGLDKTGEARVREIVESGRAKGTIDKGYRSFEEADVGAAREKADLVKKLVEDPLLLDRQKLRNVSTDEIKAMWMVVGDNTKTLEAAARVMNDPEATPTARQQAADLYDAANKQTESLVSSIVTETAQKGRELGALRNIAKQSTDAEVWLVNAKRLAPDRPLPDGVMANIRRLAREAAEACNAA